MVLALTRLETYIFKCYCRNQAPNPRIQQTMTTKFKFLFASLALASITTLSAQTVGYVSRTLNPGTANLLSVPFDQPPATFTGATSGTFETISATSFTDNEAGWAVNFASAANPYFIKITSGVGAGLYFQAANGSNTSTVVNLLAGEQNPTTLGIVAGDTYTILLGQTIKKFFTGIAVNQGTSTTGDQVFLLSNSTWVGPYAQNVSGVWKSGFLTVDDQVIRPDTGLYFFRRNLNGALTITVSGVVPSVNQRYELPNATSNFVNTTFPVDTNLLASGIQNISGWTSTDRVFIFNDGTWASATWNGTAWKDGFLTVNTRAILAGQPVFIVKNSGAAGTRTAYNRAVPY